MPGQALHGLQRDRGTSSHGWQEERIVAGFEAGSTGLLTSGSSGELPRRAQASDEPDHGFPSSPRMLRPVPARLSKCCQGKAPEAPAGRAKNTRCPGAVLIHPVKIGESLFGLVHDQMTNAGFIKISRSRLWRANTRSKYGIASMYCFDSNILALGAYHRLCRVPGRSQQWSRQNDPQTDSQHNPRKSHGPSSPSHSGENSSSLIVVSSRRE